MQANYLDWSISLCISRQLDALDFRFTGTLNKPTLSEFQWVLYMLHGVSHNHNVVLVTQNPNNYYHYY